MEINEAKGTNVEEFETSLNYWSRRGYYPIWETYFRSDKASFMSVIVKKDPALDEINRKLL